MVKNILHLSVKGTVPLLSSEEFQGLMCSGGVVALLNSGGSAYHYGDEGVKVLQFLLEDPARTGVHRVASVKTRGNRI